MLGFGVFHVPAQHFRVNIVDIFEILINLDLLPIEDASDLYGVLGLGADIGIGKTFYIRISADFDYNLSAKPSNPIAGVTYSGYKINGGLAIGFKL